MRLVLHEGHERSWTQSSSVVSYTSALEAAMTSADQDRHDSDLPNDLSQPARRALAAAGYARLQQLTHVSEDELLALHGVGPKTIDQLRRALRVHGQSFGTGERSGSQP